jgi:hypothetical protein
MKKATLFGVAFVHVQVLPNLVQKILLKNFSKFDTGKVLEG